MTSHKVKMIVTFLASVFVLRFYFFTEIRHLLHFILGIVIITILISRYRELKANYQSGKAQIPLIVAYFVIFTVYIWYIQPLVVGWLS